VAFVFMGLVGTFAGMSAFNQPGRLVAAYINNGLTTGTDPYTTFNGIRLEVVYD
jgi:hypothetical protein